MIFKLKNQYLKPIPELPKKKLKRNQPSFKFGFVTGMLLASIIILTGKYIIDNYRFQSPVVIKFRMPVVRRVIDSNARKTKSNSKIAPKKKSGLIKQVQASEKWYTIYDYELLNLDADQTAIKLLIEDKLGKATAQLVFKESGFHPDSINKSSGACGLFQSYPCGKMDCQLSDISCQLNWGEQYIKNRYGTPEKALEFHNLNGWY